MPNAVKIRPLLHFHEADNILDMPLLTLHVTRFKCGGIVIGLRFNHCMGDEASMHHFMTSWAEIAKGLPTNLMVCSMKIMNFLMQSFKTLKKRYVCWFTWAHKKIMELERTLEEEEVLTMPTKLELDIAFLWREIIRSTKIEEGQWSKLLLPIDLRTKLGAGIPKGYFGNGIGVAYNGFSTGRLFYRSMMGVLCPSANNRMVECADCLVHVCGDPSNEIHALLSVNSQLMLKRLWSRNARADKLSDLKSLKSQIGVLECKVGSAVGDAYAAKGRLDRSLAAMREELLK